MKKKDDRAYAKFMCECGLTIGTFLEKETTIRCSRCGKPMRYKELKKGLDDPKWDKITFEDCKQV